MDSFAVGCVADLRRRQGVLLQAHTTRKQPILGSIESRLRGLAGVDPAAFLRTASFSGCLRQSISDEKPKGLEPNSNGYSIVLGCLWQGLQFKGP